MAGMHAPWKCLADPEGDFTGKLFFGIELDYGQKSRSWVDGTKFQHVKTRQIKTVRRGRFVVLKRRSAHA